jgi:maltooligosyltrehalose trehalohydrolase
MCDSALMWLRDYHFDGLRLDAVHAIVDTSAVHFLEQLAVEVAQLQARLGRHLSLIAESNLNDPRIVRPNAAGGFGLDAQWSDDFHHALHAWLTGEQSGYYVDFGSLAQLAKGLRNAYVYDGCYSPYRQRYHGRPPIGLSGHHFLSYAQTHDQVGNRAKGDRSSMLMSVNRLKIAAALVMTGPFIPMLFQGEEWGASTPFLYFSGHPEAELGKAVSEGRRREFASFKWNANEVPDPQAPESFTRSKLDWSELATAPHAELLQWHRNLIRLRRQSPELTDGCLDKVKLHFDEGARWLTMSRGSILVVINFAERAQRVPLNEHATPNLLLASEPAVRFHSESAEMPAETVVIAQTSLDRSTQ